MEALTREAGAMATFDGAKLMVVRLGREKVNCSACPLPRSVGTGPAQRRAARVHTPPPTRSHDVYVLFNDTAKR